MVTVTVNVASAGTFCFIFVSIHCRTASTLSLSAFETVFAMFTMTLIVATFITPFYSLTYPTS